MDSTRQCRRETPRPLPSSRANSDNLQLGSRLSQSLQVPVLQIRPYHKLQIVQSWLILRERGSSLTHAISMLIYLPIPLTCVSPSAWQGDHLPAKIDLWAATFMCVQQPPGWQYLQLLVVFPGLLHSAMREPRQALQQSLGCCPLLLGVPAPLALLPSKAAHTQALQLWAEIGQHA